MAITIRTVQSLPPGATVWDDAVKGFGVRKQRRDAVYVIKYRTFGRQRFVTLGRHGAWTPDKARREAKRLLGLVAAGKDPQADKTEARDKAADTLGKVIDDYLKQAKKEQKPRTYVETERHLKINWKPLHNESVFHITRRRVAARLREIEAAKGPVPAARARAALSAMFNWAIREGFDLINPVLGTNRPAEPKSRDRVLTDSELAEIWRACADDDYGRIIKLLLLTAQRRDEVGGMRQAEIDRDNKVWTIPGLRTKNHREHTLPLTAYALALIAEGKDFVFGPPPRRKVQRGFSGWSKSKIALDQHILEARGPDAKPLDWRIHDLRRTAATVMADRLGVLPHIVETILNHVSGHKGGVAGVYNRARYEAEMRDALTRWAGHVAMLSANGG